MNHDFKLAIIALAFIAIKILITSTIATSIVYYLTLYMFQYRIERQLLNIIAIAIIMITGAITYWRISKS